MILQAARKGSRIDSNRNIILTEETVPLMYKRVWIVSRAPHRRAGNDTPLLVPPRLTQETLVKKLERAVR